MYCKYCGAEIKDNAAVCPTCGEMLVKKKADGWRLPVLIISCVILTASIVLGVLFAFGLIGQNNTEPTVPTVPVDVPPATEAPVVGEPDKVICKDNYTVNTDLLKDNLDRVVASFDGKELTNEKLQVYYWMYVSNFIYSNQNYLGYLGFNFNQQYHSQKYSDEMTWQQYFLTAAVDNWYRYNLLYSMAQKAGFKLGDEAQKILDGLPEQLQAEATSGGYASLDEMLSKELGPTCTLEDYMDFMTVYYVGLEYFTELYESYDPALKEIEDYFTEHEEDLKKNNITKDGDYVVNVRHILLYVEDTDNNGTVSDEEWEACRVKAQALLDQWAAGDRSEESFAKLANEHSEDPGSNTNGGLYEGVAKGDMLETFDAWIFDETRESGHFGLVKTKHGYHLMYYVGNEPTWVFYCREAIREDNSTKILEDAIKNTPVEVTYGNAMLGFIDMSV